MALRKPADQYSELTQTTVADACATYGVSGCGGGNYQFAFDDVDFLMWEGANLKLTVEKPGFATVTDEIEAIDGFHWARNFNLAPPPPELISVEGDL